MDSLFHLRGVRDAPADVVIVAIDEPSFREIGLHWPWPVTLHASLVERLAAHGAKAVAFDILFAEPSADSSEDAEFAAAIAHAGNVVLSAGVTWIDRKSYTQSMLTMPHRALAQTASAVGLMNLVPDSDGVVRRGLRGMLDTPTLAYSAAEVCGCIQEEHGENAFLIDYIGPSGSIRTVSYYQALDPARYLTGDVFKDAVVLVGLASAATVDVEGPPDAFPTPFSRFSQGRMHGVEIHASAVATLSHGPRLCETSPLWQVFLCASAGPILVRARRRPVLVVGITVGVVLVLGLVSSFLFLSWDLVLDVTGAMAAAAGCGLICGVHGHAGTVRAKRRLRTAFDRYVAPDVVDVILRHPENLRLGGEKRELTVLFSDIRGFTSVAERLAPDDVVAVLNTFLNRMTDTILSFHGTLDKYMGDGVMAIFGAPLQREDHALCACKAALAMLEGAGECASAWENRGAGSLSMGIGINTGLMVVGNIGSDKRFDYTVVGDEVNLASRIEGLSKIYGAPIIISHNTYQVINGAFTCRELDLVRVRGKRHPVRIYELVFEGSGDGAWSDVLSAFDEGLTAYRRQDWDKAAKAFERVLAIREEDRPSALFLERISSLRTLGRVQAWDGIWDFGFPRGLARNPQPGPSIERTDPMGDLPWKQ